MSSRLLALKGALPAALVAAAFGCQGGTVTVGIEGRPFALDAYCDAVVDGVGLVEVETDYLPHVVACENGGADFEALKAQAVAARTYLYYKLDDSGSIGDGTGDQVYTCANEPQAEHYQAVEETAGQVVSYAGVTICAFYVAGAVPSADDCVAVDGDDDYSGTEHYVTYNWGLSGADVEQTTLGWVDPGNDYNRGCKSQNGADCLSEDGWLYDDILRFYYGMDLVLETAQGECVEAPDAGPDADSDSDSDADSDSDSDADTDSDSDCEDGDCSSCGGAGSCSSAPGQARRTSLLGMLPFALDGSAEASAQLQ